jgi:F0F1-type ATP synthase assembly protein I
MAWLLFKYGITAALVVLISEFAKRSDRLGGFIAALPLITLLTLIWLYVERQPAEKIASHAYYTFWYVLPTLPMFLVFPALLERVGFWWSLLGGALLTVACFAGLALSLRRFGINLLPT